MKKPVLEIESDIDLEIGRKTQYRPKIILKVSEILGEFIIFGVNQSYILCKYSVKMY